MTPEISTPDPSLRNSPVVAALAGGVGGAKLAEGFFWAIPAENLSVIVNTGDDFQHLGLHISPDVDTVTYTLAGVADPERGWGRAEETWLAMETLQALGGPTWFRLGDRDLGLHLERTNRLNHGDTLSHITRDFCRRLGVDCQVLPMSDQPVRTIVQTQEGRLPFQEYFVARGCEPVVQGFEFQGAKEARPAPGVLEALRLAEVVVICPSNPWVSVDPILAVPGIREAVEQKMVIAVSPIIGGEALKGPAAKMFRELGQEADVLAIAKHYRGLAHGLVIDQKDADYQDRLESMGIESLVTDTVMKHTQEKVRLAVEVLEFVEKMERVK